MKNGIYSEVRMFVTDKIESGESIRVDWLSNEIIQSKSNIDGDDYPFYRVCALAHIQEVVRQCIGKYNDASSKKDEQLVLDGFEHLQKAYTVVRNNVNMLIPIDLLTDEELFSRAEEYKLMAKGCLKHAKEIKNFISNRSSSKVA